MSRTNPNKRRRWIPRFSLKMLLCGMMLFAIAMGLLVRPVVLQQRGMQIVLDLPFPHVNNPFESPEHHVESRLAKFYWQNARRLLGDDAVLCGVEADFKQSPLSKRQLLDLCRMPVKRFYWLRVDHSAADDNFAEALKSWPHLAELSLANTEITDKALGHLGDIPTLQKLNLSLTNVTKERLDQFTAEHPDLYIVWSPRISQRDADAVRKCVLNDGLHVSLNYNTLAINPSPNEDGLVDLSPMAEIESRVSMAFGPSNFPDTSKERETLSKLTCVRSVSFDFCDCSDDLTWLTEFPNLESVVFEYCEIGNLPAFQQLPELIINGNNITDAHVMSLPPGSRLESLCIQGDNQITDKAFERIGTFTDLRELAIAGLPRVTDAALEELTNLQSLRHLTIYIEGVQSIGPLAKLKDLTNLKLRFCQIDDDDLDPILTLPNLTYIDVTDTLVTERGVRKLIQSITTLNSLTNNSNMTADMPEFQAIRESGDNKQRSMTKQSPTR